MLKLLFVISLPYLGSEVQKEVFFMNKYELVLILNPNAEEEVLKLELSQTQELIEKFGGTIDKVDDWGKRRLAYEIDKFQEGFYNFIHFTSGPDVPREVENRIRIRENVIRYLIVRKED